MLKKFLYSFFIFLLVITIPLAFYFLEAPIKVKADKEKVLYQLPYPGILPDHPLYFIKAIRDRLMDFLTRSYIEKAKLYLLYSNKRVNSAILLSQKGKNNLAITTFSKGEKYFLKIPSLLKEAKEQGQEIPAGFIEELKLANAKHKEIAEGFLKIMPQGMATSVMEIIKLNEEIKSQLDKF